MIRIRTLLTVVLAATAVFARASYNTQYDVTFDGPATFDVTSLMLYEETANSSSLTWPFGASSPGETVITNPFPTDTPVLASLLLGLTHDLPGDAPGQQHVVLFMSDEAASAANHIAWGTLFRHETEEDIISDIALATSGQDWPIIQPGLDGVFGFANGDAKTGILGTNGPISTLFSPTGTFTAMTFSEGTVVGHGIATTTQSTPEPASMAAIGFGLVALIRRRKKA